MNGKIKIYCYLAACATWLTFLLVNSGNDGAREYAEAEELIRAINKSNTELDAAVLSLQLGLVEDYDDLSRREKTFDSFLSLADDKQTNFVARQVMASLAPLINEKTLLTSDFKASHSINQIALAGFSRHSRRARSESYTTTKNLTDLIANFEIVGSRFVAFGNADDERLFQSTILEIEEFTKQNGDKAASLSSLRLALRHARLLIDRRKKLDRVIEQLTSLPIQSTAQTIIENAAQNSQSRAQSASLYRFLLAITVAALLGFCFRQYFLVYKHKSDLTELNRNLEHRVATRTEELASANQELEAAIAEANKLALVAKFTDNAVIITDIDGVIEWVNLGFERITGFSADEAIGKCTEHLLHGPDSDKAIIAQMKHAIRNQTPFDVEILKYRKNGQPFWMAIEGRPIGDSRGDINQFILIESDISSRINADLERQRLNEQLVDASRTAGIAEVATGVLHNVGNVLNSLNVSALVIEKQLQNSALEKLARISDLIETHSEDFGLFVNSDGRGKKIPAYISNVTKSLMNEHETMASEFVDLLDNVQHIKEIVAIQQESAKPIGVLESLNAGSVIENAILANHATLTNHNVQVTHHIADGTPDFVSDKRRILQILINLISNAKDSVKPLDNSNRHVDISAQVIDHSIEFEVTDNGLGIPAQNIEKIFQLGYTTKDNSRGFGLHISANVASELGGSLVASSPGTGHGATFRLSIPIRSKQANEKTNPDLLPTEAVS